jgi:hypothetical protein
VPRCYKQDSCLVMGKWSTLLRLKI